jgi:hypothetical protein
MRREIQNPQIFQPNPESFSRAIIFKPNLGHLAPASEVAGRHALLF